MTDRWREREVKRHWQTHTHIHREREGERVRLVNRSWKKRQNLSPPLSLDLFHFFSLFSSAGCKWWINESVGSCCRSVVASFLLNVCVISGDVLKLFVNQKKKLIKVSLDEDDSLCLELREKRCTRTEAKVRILILFVLVVSSENQTGFYYKSSCWWFRSEQLWRFPVNRLNKRGSVCLSVCAVTYLHFSSQLLWFICRVESLCKKTECFRCFYCRTNLQHPDERRKKSGRMLLLTRIQKTAFHSQTVHQINRNTLNQSRVKRI